MNKLSTVFIVAGLLTACSTRPPAPIVVERTTTPTASATSIPVQTTTPGAAIVAPVTPPSAPIGSDQFLTRRGDTWVTLARQFNLNPRELAQWNNASVDSPLREGQVIRIQAPVTLVPAPIAATPIPIATPAVPSGEVKREPKAVKIPYSDEAYNRLTRTTTAVASASRAAAPSPIGAAQAAVVPSAPLAVPPPTGATSSPAAAPAPIVAAPSAEVDSIAWQWPVVGKVTKKFSETTFMKGIGVDGKGGTPIYAAANGRVAYAGEGMRGYGRMIILRHSDQYTSVYAHNSVLNVKEGDSVKRGQKIAEMGNTESDATRLFFEVRRAGKALDPEKILPSR